MRVVSQCLCLFLVMCRPFLTLLPAPAFADGAKQRFAQTNSTSTSASKESARIQAQKRIEEHVAFIAAQKAAMDKLYDYGNAEPTVVEAFKQRGVKDVANSPARNWAGSLASSWHNGGAKFYNYHASELDKALQDAKSGVLKQSELSRFDAGMQKWKVKEKQLAEEFAKYVDNWARQIEFKQRRDAEADRQWKLLAPTGGSTTYKVQEAMAPMDEEGKKIVAEEDVIWKRIDELFNTKVFSYDMSQEYGH